MVLVPLWVNATLRREKAVVLDALRLCKSFRSFLAAEPSGIFPRHPAAFAVEVQAPGQTVLPDLYPLFPGHAEIDRWG